MSEPATRQELQNALDRTKSSIMGNMISRGDLQTIINQIRIGILQDLHALHAENKSSIRQASIHRDQIMQRINNLEHSVARVEQLLTYAVSQQTQTSNRMQNMKTDSGYNFQRI